jgi:hypothetical protein
VSRVEDTRGNSNPTGWSLHLDQGDFERAFGQDGVREWGSTRRDEFRRARKAREECFRYRHLVSIGGAGELAIIWGEIVMQWNSGDCKN